MLSLEKVNSLAIGTYRMGAGNTEHEESLAAAIRSGVNMIDTASNYTLGKAEKLIGNVTKSFRNDVFIITKIGYVNETNERFLKDVATSKVHKDKKGSIHCIDPIFFSLQLEQSLHNLRTDYIDCLLLHNPERCLSSGLGLKKLYDEIEKALLFCEGLRLKGIIRYYGISSNTIHDPLLQNSININIINPKRYPGFKFIQFPHNLLEDKTKSKHYDGSSIFELAKRMGLKTIINRPFNTIKNGKIVRLVEPNRDINIEELFKKDEIIFSSLLEITKEKLIEMNIKDDIVSFRPILELKEHRTNLGSPEAVEKFYKSRIMPFFEQVFANGERKKITKKIERLKRNSVVFSNYKIWTNSKEVKNDMISAGLIKKDKGLIQHQALNKYKEDGADYILVGMTKKKYVDDLKQMI